MGDQDGRMRGERVPNEQEVALVLEKMLLEGDLSKVTMEEIMIGLSQHFVFVLENLSTRKEYVRGAIMTFVEQKSITC